MMENLDFVVVDRETYREKLLSWSHLPKFRPMTKRLAMVTGRQFVHLRSLRYFLTRSQLHNSLILCDDFHFDLAYETITRRYPNLDVDKITNYLRRLYPAELALRAAAAIFSTPPHLSLLFTLARAIKDEEHGTLTSLRGVYFATILPRHRFVRVCHGSAGGIEVMDPAEWLDDRVVHDAVYVRFYSEPNYCDMQFGGVAANLKSMPYIDAGFTVPVRVWRKMCAAAPELLRFSFIKVDPFDTEIIVPYRFTVNDGSSMYHLTPILGFEDRLPAFLYYRVGPHAIGLLQMSDPRAPVTYLLDFPELPIPPKITPWKPMLKWASMMLPFDAVLLRGME